MLGRLQRILGWPRGFGYYEEEIVATEFTASVTLSATTEATANTIVTAPERMFDGKSAYIIEFFCPLLTHNSDGTTSIWLYRDGVSIGRIGIENGNSSSAVVSSASGPVLMTARMVPPGGKHIFSIRGSTSGSTPVATAGVGGLGNYMPGRIRILRLTGLDG